MRLVSKGLIAMSRTLAAVAALFVVVAPAVGQDVAVGDTITLVERQLHIPAHPAPGDNHVSFRFQSGSQATVLDLDSATTWVRIRGETVDGGSASGWITRKYIASTEASAGDLLQDELAWCPPKGSPGPHPAGRLRIATWNLGNLHSQDGQSIFVDSVKRQDVDYKRIRCYVRLFDPDILAVQEVDGEAALQRVVDTDVYDVHVSSRPLSGLGGKQNTGFAYKTGLSVSEKPDFTDLDVSNGSLRHGTRLDVEHNGTTVKLMSVHLKSGCFSNNTNNAGDCQTLSEQIPILEGWIDEEAEGPEPFIVLGDFNRRFNEPLDVAWSDLDDGDPPNADLTSVTLSMPISCRGNEFTRFIDHIIVDKRAVAFVEFSSFRHVTFRQDDKDDWDRISDHCPVVVDLWLE
jgi:endonuclease/exonuclease/phosphatase family metal-dependent hydrolase